MFEIFENIKNGYLIGYVIGIISLCGWFIHNKWQRKKIAFEMRRIGLEKSELQKVQGGNIIKSSEN